MRILLLALLALCAACNAISFFEVVAEEWETWKANYGKNYSDSTEEKFRLKIYMENKAMIARHNAQAHAGEKSYFLKMNHYGDLLHHEFTGTMNGYDFAAKKQLRSNGIDDPDKVTWIAPANIVLPDEVDWRKKGAVTPVKNQGSCGACWAFSATGSLEGQHFRKTGKLLSLSEQNLLDCSTQAWNNNGCDGGLMDNAFRYIKANGGIDTEASYPYGGYQDSCQFSRRNVGETDKGYVDIPTGNEESLKRAVATVGPVSVAIAASHSHFQFYSHGILDIPSECGDLDHGVLAVGYGTENGKDYWIVKNSWSAVWGEEGYIRMSRNKNNQCGIASLASYPLV